MLSTNWPIQPPFLSIRKGINKNSDHYFPNRDGLLRTDELRGFLADASDDSGINNILALFQVVHSDFEIEDKERRTIEDYSPKDDAFIKNILKERKIVRIFPGELYNNIEPCKFFRKKCGSEDKCFEMDSRIALLYHPDLKNIHFENDFDKFFEALKKIIQDYSNHSKDDSIKVEKSVDGKYLYVKYQCPHSTLEEYFFPIIYSGKVIAALMQGQRFPEDFSQKKMFVACRSECAAKERSEFKTIIEKTVKTYTEKPDNKEPMSNMRQKAIINRIEQLNDRIKEAIDAEAQKYVTKQFLRIESDFRKHIKAIDEKKPDALQQFKTELNKALSNISNTFNPEGFIRIYAIRPPIEQADSNTDEFDLIGDSSDNTNSPKYTCLKFNNIPDKINGKEKEDLLKYIKNRPGRFEPEDVFRMDVPFVPQMAYIVWKRYSDWVKKYQTQREIHHVAMKSMYHTLLEPFFILHGINLEKKLEDSLRVTGHEASQVIPAVIQTINTPESLETIDSGDTYQGEPFIQKPSYKILDASYRLLLLENLFSRSRLIFKNDIKQEELDWYDFHRIIYAAASLFEVKVQYQTIQKIDISLPTEMSKYLLKTHYGYLSHVLFNLVDNAMKYGFRGTNIEINVTEEYEPVIQKVFNRKDINKIIISVVSYGAQIPDTDIIFDLYYRAESSLKVEGMGIGLFLVKKLCNLMGYEIKCVSSWRDNYNIAVKYYYAKQNSKYADDQSLDPATIQLLNRNISKENLKVINIPENPPTSPVKWIILYGELKELINIPVYRNEFQITIPVKTLKTEIKNRDITVEYDHLKKY